MVKYLFILMCVLSAILLSLLAAILRTGRIPFQPALAPAVAAAPAEQRAQEESLTVFTGSAKAVDELITALRFERERYANLVADTMARGEELRLQEELMGRVRDELAGLKAQVDETIGQASAEEDKLRRDIEVSERKNMRRLSDVYSKMDPVAAAEALQKLDKERAARILSLMSERQAAGILDAAVAADARGAVVVAEWSDIMRRLKSMTAKNQEGA